MEEERESGNERIKEERKKGKRRGKGRKRREKGERAHLMASARPLPLKYLRMGTAPLSFSLAADMIEICFFFFWFNLKKEEEERKFLE